MALLAKAGNEQANFRTRQFPASSLSAVCTHSVCKLRSNTDLGYGYGARPSRRWTCASGRRRGTAAPPSPPRGGPSPPRGDGRPPPPRAPGHIQRRRAPDVCVFDEFDSVGLFVRFVFKFVARSDVKGVIEKETQIIDRLGGGSERCGEVGDLGPQSAGHRVRSVLL